MLKPNQIVVIKFLFKEPWGALEEVLRQGAKDFARIVDAQDEKSLAEAIVQAPASIVIACVKGKDELGVTLNFLKKYKALVKEGNLKFSAISFLNNKAVETALLKLGTQEVLEPTTKSRQLKFKLDLNKKALTGGKNKFFKGKLETQDEGELQLKKGNSSEKGGDRGDFSGIKWLEACKNVDDIWLYKDRNDPKKILGRWLIKFIGPSPFVAQWTENPNQKGVWKFTFKDDLRENYQTADGDWYYIGDNKPEFVWKENKWMVSGQKFSLFYKEGEEKSYRFRANPKVLEICKNSSYALSREQSIIETFDQEVLVKKGMISEDSANIEKEENSDGELEGEFTVDEVKEGLLEGETSTDHYGDLKGKKKKSKAEDLGGHYSGDSETDVLEDDPLEGDIKTEHKKDKNYAHDSSQNENDDLDGDVDTEDLGASKYKGKLSHKKDVGDADYGGEVGTDDLGPSHYKGKSKKKVEDDFFDEEDESETLEKKKKQKKDTRSLEDSEREPLSGKSSTDDLGSTHYSNKKMKKVQSNSEEADISDDSEEDFLEGPEDLASTSVSRKKKSSQNKPEIHDFEELDEGESSDDPLFDGVVKKKKAKGNFNKNQAEENEGEKSEDFGDEFFEEGEQDTISTDFSDSKLVPLPAEKKNKSERDRKMNLLDELLPDATAQDPGVEVKVKTKDNFFDEKKNPEANVLPFGKAKDKESVAEQPSGSTEDAIAQNENAAVICKIKHKDMMEPTIDARVDDSFDNIVSLLIKGSGFQTGEILSIDLKFEYMGKSKTVEIIGKISETQAFEAETYLTVELEGENQGIMQKFLRLYQLRQMHVTEFLKQAKGY